MEKTLKKKKKVKIKDCLTHSHVQCHDIVNNVEKLNYEPLIFKNDENEAVQKKKKKRKKKLKENETLFEAEENVIQKDKTSLSLEKKKCKKKEKEASLDQEENEELFSNKQKQVKKKCLKFKCDVSGEKMDEVQTKKLIIEPLIIESDENKAVQKKKKKQKKKFKENETFFESEENVEQKDQNSLSLKEKNRKKKMKEKEASLDQEENEELFSNKQKLLNKKRSNFECDVTGAKIDEAQNKKNKENLQKKCLSKSDKSITENGVKKKKQKLLDDKHIKSTCEISMKERNHKLSSKKREKQQNVSVTNFTSKVTKQDTTVNAFHKNKSTTKNSVEKTNPNKHDEVKNDIKSLSSQPDKDITTKAPITCSTQKESNSLITAMWCDDVDDSTKNCDTVITTKAEKMLLEHKVKNSLKRNEARNPEKDQQGNQTDHLPAKRKKLENNMILNINSDIDGSARRAFKDKDPFAGSTHIVAIDCEMVGVGDLGKKSILARVALVNEFGKCIYDKYVKPTEKVTDYRTQFSGIRPKDIIHGEEFESVQKEVKTLIKGRLLVGHALWNDTKVLCLNHPSKYTRDTARYPLFGKLCSRKSPPLQLMCRELLGLEIQKGEHDPVQDAQAALKLYLTYKDQWEIGLQHKKQTKQKRAEKIASARRIAMS